METWAQHYQVLYSKENSIINAAVENTKHSTNHGRTRCTTIYQRINGSSSDPFPNKRCEQWCALAPTLSGIFFSWLLSNAIDQSNDRIYLQARTLAQTKVHKVLIREMFFADDAAVTAPTGEALRRLIYCLVIAWKEQGPQPHTQ